jgi:LEA14-like dessication related protein
MKKILPIAAVIGAGAYLYYFLRNKARAGENLKFELLKITIDTQRTKQALFFKVFYDITLNVINSENAAVVVKNINFDLTANGKALGNISQTLNFNVPAQDTKQVMIKASFFTLGALLTIKDIILNGLNLDVNIRGFVDTDLGRVNVDFNQQINTGINGRPKKKKYC